MELGEIRVAIADAVRAGVPSLTCLGYVPDSVTPPVFFTAETDITFDQAFRRGLDEAIITCRLLVSRSDDRSGQAELDRYLAGSGQHSVKAALEVARGAPGQAALGGLADDLHVQRIQGYRLYEVGGVEFYGAEFIVRVIGEG